MAFSNVVRAPLSIDFATSGEALFMLESGIGFFSNMIKVVEAP